MHFIPPAMKPVIQNAKHIPGNAIANMIMHNK